MIHLENHEAKRIRNYIDRSNLKHKDIYLPMQMHKSVFSRRYHGHSRWNTSELKKLAQIVGCSYSDLVM